MAEVSKKSIAKLKGKGAFEWDKFLTSLQEVGHEYETDRAVAQGEQKKKSKLSKLLGTVAFVATFLATGGVSAFTGLAQGVKGAFWGALGAGKGWGAIGSAAAAYGAGVGASYITHEAGAEAALASLPEAYAKKVYRPQFGAGEASRKIEDLRYEAQEEATALKAWEEGGLESAMYEYGGRATDFFAQSGGMG